METSSVPRIRGRSIAPDDTSAVAAAPLSHAVNGDPVPAVEQPGDIAAALFGALLTLESASGLVHTDPDRAAQRINWVIDSMGGAIDLLRQRSKNYPVLRSTHRLPKLLVDHEPPVYLPAVDRMARERLKFLVEASDVLAHSPGDVDPSLQALCDLAVPRLADWCIIELQHGQRQRLSAIAHGDPAGVAITRDLYRRYGSLLNHPAGGAMLTEGRIPAVTDELLQDLATDEQHLDALRHLGLRSMLVVPLEVGDQRVGTLVLAHAESRRRHSRKDHALAKELARRAAITVANARLFTEHSHVAEMLQRSLLPPQLPDIPGVELASHYRPAVAAAAGGDFYDALGSGQDWTLVIGDVRGKGLEAATLASVARHTVRAAALRDPDPTHILGVLNDALLEHDPLEGICTAVCAHLHVSHDEATLDVATGGHPAPLVLQGDGTLVSVETTGPLVGAWPGSQYPAATIRLQPGDLLFFYTDGLSEARADGDLFGTDRTEAAVRATAGMSAQAALEHIHTTVESSRFTQRDDVALLALRFLPST